LNMARRPGQREDDNMQRSDTAGAMLINSCPPTREIFRDGDWYSGNSYLCRAASVWICLVASAMRLTRRANKDVERDRV
jgi:hypothetical protein